MKIAIVGTHSTGKTTFARALAQELGIPFIAADISKELCREYFSGRPPHVLNAQEMWRFQNMMYDRCEEILAYRGSLVTDGIHLTCLAYGLRYTQGGMTQHPGYVALRNSILDKSRCFDSIFFLRPEIALENDNFRSTDVQLRLDVDSMLASYLQSYRHKTLTGSLRERTLEARDTLYHTTVRRYEHANTTPRYEKKITARTSIK